MGESEYNETTAAVVDLSGPKQPSRKRGKYANYDGENRAKIVKYASEHGNRKAIDHFASEYQGLKESTVHTFKKAYQDQLATRRKQGNVQPVTSLEVSKRGRPPSLL